MKKNTIIMFVVRDGDKLNAKYQAVSREKGVFDCDDMGDASLMDAVEAEELVLSLLRDKDKRFPIALLLPDDCEMVERANPA